MISRRWESRLAGTGNDTMATWVHSVVYRSGSHSPWYLVTIRQSSRNGRLVWSRTEFQKPDSSLVGWTQTGQVSVRPFNILQLGVYGEENKMYYQPRPYDLKWPSSPMLVYHVKRSWTNIPAEQQKTSMGTQHRNATSGASERNGIMLLKLALILIINCVLNSVSSN